LRKITRDFCIPERYGTVPYGRIQYVPVDKYHVKFELLL